MCASALLGVCNITQDHAPYSRPADSSIGLRSMKSCCLAWYNFEFKVLRAMQLPRGCWWVLPKAPETLSGLWRQPSASCRRTGSQVCFSRRAQSQRVHRTM